MQWFQPSFILLVIFLDFWLTWICQFVLNTGIISFLFCLFQSGMGHQSTCAAVTSWLISKRREHLITQSFIATHADQIRNYFLSLCNCLLFLFFPIPGLTNTHTHSVLVMHFLDLSSLNLSSLYDLTQLMVNFYNHSHFSINWVWPETPLWARSTQSTTEMFLLLRLLSCKRGRWTAAPPHLTWHRINNRLSPARVVAARTESPHVFPDISGLFTIHRASRGWGVIVHVL